MFVSLELFIKTIAHYPWLWFLFAVACFFAAMYVYFWKGEKWPFSKFKNKLFISTGISAILLFITFWFGAKYELENWLVTCYEQSEEYKPSISFFPSSSFDDEDQNEYADCPTKDRTRLLYRELTGENIGSNFYN